MVENTCGKQRSESCLPIPHLSDEGDSSKERGELGGIKKFRTLSTASNRWGALRGAKKKESVIEGRLEVSESN